MSYGNPALAPEQTDSYELSYSTFGKKSSLNAAVYARRTGNSIERYSLYNEALARTEATFGNLATNATYGLSLFGSLRPTTAWNLSGSVNTSYSRLQSAALNRTSRRLNLNTNLNSSLKMGRRYSLQGFGFFSTGSVQLQARYNGFLSYSLGLRRTLLRDKGDLTLNATNFLQPGRAFTSVTSTAQFRSESVSYQYQRAVRLSFNYRFGKIDNGSPRRRRAVQNDDSKAGGS